MIKRYHTLRKYLEVDVLRSLIKYRTETGAQPVLSLVRTAERRETMRERERLVESNVASAAEISEVYWKNLTCLNSIYEIFFFV